MNQADHYKHSMRRAGIRDRILAAPGDYMVCDQCQSISTRKARVCSVCSAYRWDESVERVTEVAKLIGESVVPVTLGFVPRLEEEKVRSA